MFERQKMVEIKCILDVTKYTDGLKAIVFDMDDTLYSEKEYVRSGYKKIAEIYPYIDGVEEKLWKFFLDGRLAIDEFLRQEKLLTEANKESCLFVYRFQKPDIHLYTGVKKMLIELRKKHHIGLITDGRPEGQREKIKALKLESIMDEIIVTDELGGIEYRKPNMKAYKLMAENLHVKYSQMCYVGDNKKKDFIAPMKLGMKCIWFNNRDGIYR